MPDETAIETASLVTSAETAAAGRWESWDPLIPGEATRGTYSLMEQLMPAKAPAPHVHDQGEEVFYILDGEMALQLGDQVVIGTSGQLVRIPAGAPHAFAVKTETARVLNSTFPPPSTWKSPCSARRRPALPCLRPEHSDHRPPSRNAPSPSGCTTWPPRRCPRSRTCSETTETTTPHTPACHEPTHRRPSRECFLWRLPAAKLSATRPPPACSYLR